MQGGGAPGRTPDTLSDSVGRVGREYIFVGGGGGGGAGAGGGGGG
ncbi:PE family protein, partial [Pseudoalteromonas sp. S1609]